MPSAVSPNPRAGSAGPNRTDNAMDFDAAVEDFLNDLPIRKDAQNNNAPQEPAKDIDEEVTVKKKRKPVPKLDQARLLSDAGIPRLRKIMKSQLKFRGKGHEFSDISRLLSTYQLWLDDLFPRAKFKDGLIDIEKVGHTKRMQVMRRGWLDATKPYQRDASPERLDDVFMSGALPTTNAATGGENAAENEEDTIFGRSLHEAHNDDTANNKENDGPDDDELDALLAENGDGAAGATVIQAKKPRGPFEEDDSDQDDLDALLAEQTSEGPNDSGKGHKYPSQDPSTTQRPDDDDDFADEEEAMAAMDMW